MERQHGLRRAAEHPRARDPRTGTKPWDLPSFRAVTWRNSRGTVGVVGEGDKERGIKRIGGLNGRGSAEATSLEPTRQKTATISCLTFVPRQARDTRRHCLRLRFWWFGKLRACHEQGLSGPYPDRPHRVEPGGIEPPCRDSQPAASTRLVAVLMSPPRRAATPFALASHGDV